ncbi:hypothetical protein MPSEU_001014000 [Mayamaea pseudoterrestris]|nr:hypothetical protein MPSEU_001014000 [Mayamaea pseudoterrestris]
MLDTSEGHGDKKTTKLNQLNTQIGRRLVEYFVVISSVERPPEEAASISKADASNPDNSWRTESTTDEDEDWISKFLFRPTITARYPLTDHDDNPLHENVAFFCHHSGGIQVRTDPLLPKVHYFVATGGTGRQVYGTCLTLWEPHVLTIKETKENKNVFLPKCLVILSTYPYLTAFREYLTQLNTLTKSGAMTLPVERYIVNFCSEIPAPPPGSFEVQTTMLDSVIKIWSPPHNMPVQWVSLPFGPLFECLDIDNIILVWHCMVLERQVLITSTQLSVLVQASEIFLSLLFPLKWSHAYIPLLPHFLIPILSAPMPFLCGIHKENLADALYDLSAECVLVDLDKNLVTLGPETAPLPPLPPFQASVLQTHLEVNCGMVFREARSLTKNDDYSDCGTYLPNHIKMMAEAMWESKLSLFDEAFHLYFTPEEARKNHLNGNDASGMDATDRMNTNPLALMSSQRKDDRKQSQWDAVQEAFLDTFVYLLRNYRNYLVFPSKHNEGSYGGAGFRSKEFIESQRYDMREFLEQLIATQMFDSFITKRLYGSGEVDVSFFDDSVDRFLKNAGLFSNLALQERLIDASGMKTNQSNSKRTPYNKPKRYARVNYASIKKDDPLLQSARVHRKLKTIVPPEPTGEGLPPVPLLVETNEYVVAASLEGDDSSNSSRGSRSRTSGNSAPNSPGRKVLKMNDKKSLPKFVYDIFPSTFRKELFGTPRPLPAAVIAEFDRQRKDAAQFRRKGMRQPKDTKLHIHRAHATTDPVEPPSAEVATFTVFFMAFTAVVGKELINLATTKESDEKTILSTYVASSTYDSAYTSDAESETDNESNRPVDPQELADVAEMKTSRPNMGSMFGDEDEDAVSTQAPSIPEEKKSSQEITENVNPPTSPVRHENENDGTSMNGDSIHSEDSFKSARSGQSGATEDSRQRDRFRNKLSDLQIEEAKVTGRAQLGLAFELLTMMKKRMLKADPESYQCLIDACGRVGDTKRATDLLAKMHEDGIVADGTVYACLVSAFSADSAWKGGKKDKEVLPEWASSAAVEMDWNKLQKRSLLDRIVSQVMTEADDDDASVDEEGMSAMQKLRSRLSRRNRKAAKGLNNESTISSEDNGLELFVTETVERQIALGENLLEIVFPDISIDTENEVCPRCNYLLSDDDVVTGWKPDSNEYTTSCTNCTQRFVPHFCVQCSSPNFVGSRGPASPLLCERLSPWVLQKEIRSVMSSEQGIENLLDPKWREREYKNAVLWWNLVLSCMRFRLPFSFLLQGSFEQNLIAPMPEDEE